MIDGENNDTIEVDNLGCVALIRITEHSTGAIALASLSLNDLDELIDALHNAKTKIYSALRKGKRTEQ